MLELEADVDISLLLRFSQAYVECQSAGFIEDIAHSRKKKDYTKRLSLCEDCTDKVFPLLFLTALFKKIDPPVR